VKFSGVVKEIDEDEAADVATTSNATQAVKAAVTLTAAEEAKATVKVVKVSGLDPPDTTRRILLLRLKKSGWELRTNATVGEEDGDPDDAYYFNTKTNESSWEKPAEFDAEQQMAYEGIDFDSDADFEDNYETIGIDSDAAIADRDKMRTTGDTASDKRVFGRLQSLLKLMQESGSDEEWREVISDNDYALITNIASHLGKKTSADVRALAGRLLSGSCDLAPPHEAPKVFVKAIGGPDSLWAHLEQGFREAYAVHEPNDEEAGGQDEDAEREWAELLQKFCHYLKAKGVKSLPPAGLIDTMFTVIGSALGHDAFLQMSLAMCSLNALFDDDVKKNLVVRACISNPKSEHWGEAIVHELNEGASGDQEMLSNILKVIADLYADKSTSNFFYTNDLYVMVDIIVRELVNLPPPSAMRVPYLKALSHLLQTSPWFGQGKQYRREDIADAICSGIIDAFDSDNTFNKDVYEMAKTVMSECSELLEE